MNCKQIRDLLDDYNANELPGFKVTWVAQHLGGCQACRVHVALPQVECKPVPSVEWPDEEPRAEPTAALPRWIPAAVFALMLCVALLILLLQHLNQAEAGIARSQSLRYKSSVQTQRGVTGTLAQLVRHGDVATGVIQFLGQGLASPKDLETWVTVIDSEGGAHRRQFKRSSRAWALCSSAFRLNCPLRWTTSVSLLERSMWR